MKHHALIVDHRRKDRQILEEVVTTLGHSCNIACSHAEASKLLEDWRYDYALIELAIPLKPKREARQANGLNLIGQIRRQKETFPIIATMRAPAKRDDKGLLRTVFTAMEVGATGFVLKPYHGDELDRIIARTLGMDGRAAKQAGQPAKKASKRVSTRSEFDMGLAAQSVTVCGVQTWRGPEDATIRRILVLLQPQAGGAERPAYSTVKLSKALGVPVSTITGAIRDFRSLCSRTLPEQAGVACGRNDIIETCRQGYRLSEKVKLGTSRGRPRPKRSKAAKLPADLNERQQWALGQLGKGGEVRIASLRRKFSCSERTARRDMVELRKAGLVEFVGSTRSGYFRLKR